LKKFEFKLEVLLKHRKRIEENAQREYLQARAELEECLAVIKSYYLSIENNRDDILRMQKSGQQSALQEIRGMEQFIDGQKIRVERQRQVARELMIKVEQAQERLIEAAKEFKKIEKLKERQTLEYKKDQRKLEAKRMDDLVVIRAGRKEAR